jgi:hypothetical protein
MSRYDDEDGVLAYVEDKIAAVTMVPVGWVTTGVTRDGWGWMGWGGD